MKLKGPFALIFGFSGKDRDKPGQFISSPIQGDPNKASAYSRHTVPFVHQTHVNLCGDACVEMLLAFKGKLYQANLNKNPRGVLSGLTSTDVSDKLSSAGLKNCSLPFPENRQWKAEDLGSYLRLCGPIICKGSMHFVLLVGIHEEHVFIHDPWRGANITKTLREFNGFLDWTDRDCMIVAR